MSDFWEHFERNATAVTGMLTAIGILVNIVLTAMGRREIAQNTTLTVEGNKLSVDAAQKAVVAEDKADAAIKLTETASQKTAATVGDIKNQVASVAAGVNKLLSK